MTTHPENRGAETATPRTAEKRQIAAAQIWSIDQVWQWAEQMERAATRAEESESTAAAKAQSAYMEGFRAGELIWNNNELVRDLRGRHDRLLALASESSDDGGDAADPKDMPLPGWLCPRQVSDLVAATDAAVAAANARAEKAEAEAASWEQQASDRAKDWESAYLEEKQIADAHTDLILSSAREQGEYRATIATLTRRLEEADRTLSRVLHELAGAASLCWEPKPAGVFDSEEALRHVGNAIAELRGILAGAALSQEPPHA